MKKLILGLVLALLPQIALAEYILKGPHTTVETDGSQADGSVNLITKNAGPINFYTDNVLRSSISSTGTTSYVGGLQTGGNLTFTTDASGVLSDTVDAADNTYTFMNGGGADSVARGASIQCYGNEAAGTPGSAYVSSGAVATSQLNLDGRGDGSPAIRLRTVATVGGSLLARWGVENDGDLVGDATNSGDVSLNKSGTTLRVQEATAATACMGVATPNGNTPVAITTSCAASGARIFYTRLGAITNMGVITTTTAPNGSGFSLASTGASDTGAGTVYWLIIKEAP